LRSRHILIKFCLSFTISMIFLLFSSCAAPKHSKPYLVVMTQMASGRFDETFAYYKVIGSEKTSFILPVKETFTVVEGLQPGLHLVYQIESLYKDTDVSADIRDEHGTFETENNTVTLFRRKAIVSIETMNNGTKIQRIEFRDVNESDIDDYIHYVGKIEKFSGLKVMARY